MKKAVIILLCLAWGLTGCAADPELNDIVEKMTVEAATDTDAAAEETTEDDSGISGYPSLEGEETAYVKRTFSDVLDNIEQKENKLYYIGFPDCDWCQAMVAILNQAAMEAGKEIGYVELYDEEGNTLYDRDEADEFVAYAAEHLRKNEEGEPTLYSPYVFVLRDGEIVSSHVGTLDDHKLEEGMTSEQEEKLLNIYRAMFEEVE